MDFLAFDLEIAKLFPDGQEGWQAYRPLGITCAATWDGRADVRVWSSPRGTDVEKPAMEETELGDLVDYLLAAQQQGKTLLTWNGLGFDFQVLADESGRLADCARMALEQVDMMFHIFCLKGHTLGLDKAAHGLGVAGKLAGMTGAMAPRLWAEGKWGLVLDYVAQDARTTYAVARKIEQIGRIEWLSERGGRQMVPLPDGWLTVRQAVDLPQPDTSWMRRPLARKSFYDWVSKAGQLNI